MDPSKDLAAYGYGSIAWKERMESWKQKQENKAQWPSFTTTTFENFKNSIAGVVNADL